jgi:acyl-CoA hydrolase
MESAKHSQKGKRPDESKSEITILMLASDANPRGNVYGGAILKHVDLIAGLVAKRHTGHSNIVTASIDRMTFLKPVYIGNALILSARLNYVKRSSMEVEVTVESEQASIKPRVLVSIPRGSVLSSIFGKLFGRINHLVYITSYRGKHIIKYYMIYSNLFHPSYIISYLVNSSG